MSAILATVKAFRPRKSARLVFFYAAVSCFQSASETRGGLSHANQRSNGETNTAQLRGWTVFPLHILVHTSNALMVKKKILKRKARERERMIERELWVIFVTSDAPTGKSKSPNHQNFCPFLLSFGLFPVFFSLSNCSWLITGSYVSLHFAQINSLTRNELIYSTHAVFYCQGNVQNVFKCFFKHLFISLLGLLEAF